MNVPAIILYFLGLLGVCSSILLLALRLHKKNNIVKIIIIVVLILSFCSLILGTVLNLLHLQNSSLKTEDESSEKVENNVEDNNSTKLLSDTNYSDLSFLYKLNSSENSKEANITINNNSNFIFNGTVTINILDANKNVLSTFKLPVKNLAPNSNTKSNVAVDKNASDISFMFSGDFSDEPATDSTTYIINNMAVGNNYIRFNVLSKNSSIDSLEKICKEFKSMYGNDLCSGFLIYFVNSSDSDFNDSYAEFYCDNVKSTNILTTYSDNKTYTIS